MHFKTVKQSFICLTALFMQMVLGPSNACAQSQRSNIVADPDFGRGCANPAGGGWAPGYDVIINFFHKLHEIEKNVVAGGIRNGSATGVSYTAKSA